MKLTIRECDSTKKLNNLKNKYDKIIENLLEANKDILIESFVEYYGEEHRDLITKKYNEIVFVYYIDFPSIDLVVDEYIPHVNNPSKYEDFILFNKYNKASKKGINKLFGKKKAIGLENVIGATDNKILENDYIIERLTRIFDYAQPTFFTYGNVYDTKRIIAFPIMILSDKSIIHEINHAITNERLAILVDEDDYIEEVSKTGLDTPICKYHDERMLEELINEKSSLDITNIFHRRGGSFSTFCFEIPLISDYMNNIYLIDEFYSNFRDLLKTARITENKNMLVQKVGKENYERLVQLVESNYIKAEDCVTRPNKNVQAELYELVKAMKIHADGYDPLKKEEIQNYLQEIRNKGYKITLMEEIMEEDRKR